VTAEKRISRMERELPEERAKNARLLAELPALQAEHASLQANFAHLRQQMGQVLTRLTGCQAKSNCRSKLAPRS